MQFLPRIQVWLVFLILGIVGTPSVLAQIESSNFPVVQLDESARVAAMGGRSPALATNHVGAIYSNPALLSASARRSLSLSYLNHIGDVSAGWVSYARGIDSLTTAAVGIRYLGFGSIDRADENGSVDGSFSPTDMGLTIGLSRRHNQRMVYGANLHYLMSTIDGYHSSALAIDAGVFYHIDSSGTTLGASVQHAGFVLSSLGTRDDHLPIDVRIGFTKKLAHVPLLISVTAYRLQKMDGGSDGESGLSNVLYHMLFGFEFRFSESFQIRFGYNHRRHDELQMKTRLDLAGYSIGTGIALSKVAIDYAFNSWSSIGGLHRFTLRTGL